MGAGSKGLDEGAFPADIPSLVSFKGGKANIMRNLAIFTATFGAVLLAACGSSDEGTIVTEDGERVEYDVDRDGGDTQITMRGEDGEEVVINSGRGANSVDLPDGFSLYPGARVISTANINQADGQGSMVMMQSDASPDEMVSFYRRQAEDAGIAIQMEMNSNGNAMIAGEGEGGVSFSFNATPSDDGTLGQLMIGRDLN